MLAIIPESAYPYIAQILQSPAWAALILGIVIILGYMAVMKIVEVIKEGFKYIANSVEKGFDDVKDGLSDMAKNIENLKDIAVESKNDLSIIKINTNHRSNGVDNK